MREAPRGLLRQLSLADAVMLIVSSVVGVGIFFTPGSVAASAQTPVLFFLAWIGGGAISLLGALANAELGVMYPEAGGDYVYLREAFHSSVAFLFGWLSFSMVYAGSVATLAVGVGEGVGQFYPLSGSAKTTLALLSVLAVTLLHARDVKTGAWVNTATGALKVVAILAVACSAPFIGAYSPLLPNAERGEITVASLGGALAPVIFSYSGWNASVIVAGELKDPSRTIPRSLFFGLGITVVVYLAVNAGYLFALPMATLARTVNVGEASARALFGASGGTLAASVILLSVVGCLNANAILGPRVLYRMAEDGLFFRQAASVRGAGNAPHVAVWVQGALAAAFVVGFRRLTSVLEATTFGIVLATIADTSALFVLRRVKPRVPRPYRAWGYPWLPAFYIAINCAIGASMLIGSPKETGTAMVLLLSGLPLYFFFRSRREMAARG